MVTKKTQLKKRLQRGVTLIEMLVVVAIFSIVASILLFNYSDFSTNVSLRNLTQDIALSLRKAQTYATSVQSLPNGASTTEFPSYGMTFSADAITTPFVPHSKQFVFFADILDGVSQNTKTYQSTGTCGSPAVGNECVEAFTITTGDKIISLCYDNNGTYTCSSTGALDITFNRPSPDAVICFKPAGYGGTCATTASSHAEVILESPKGVTRSVLIWNTGQIAVQ
jgi:prepilin-type N-terminal cleavage/methylation domain-containing protein